MNIFKKFNSFPALWPKSLNPATGKQRQAERYEFTDNLIYFIRTCLISVSLRPASLVSKASSRTVKVAGYTEKPKRTCLRKKR